jgi:hypothetical protein
MPGSKKPKTTAQRSNHSSKHIIADEATRSAARSLLKLLITNKGFGNDTCGAKVLQPAPTVNHFVTRQHLLQIFSVVFPMHKHSLEGRGSQMLKLLAAGAEQAFGSVSGKPICAAKRNSNGYFRMGTDPRLGAQIWRYGVSGVVYKGFTWVPLEFSKQKLMQVYKHFTCRWSLTALTFFYSGLQIGILCLLRLVVGTR